MARTDWAHRSVCHNCKAVTGGPHLDGSNFWCNRCPRCGNKAVNELCRVKVIRKVPFRWWNPATWLAFQAKMEFK